MKSTFFILATLAVSGFAASLRQESPKFLSQQEADTNNLDIPAPTDAAPAIVAKRTYDEQVAHINGEIDQNAPGRFNAAWARQARKIVQETPEGGHPKLLMNMTRTHVDADNIANGNEVTLLTASIPELIAETTADPSVIDAVEEVSAGSYSAPVVPSIIVDAGMAM